MYNIAKNAWQIATAQFKIHAVHVWMGTHFTKDNVFNALNQAEFMVNVQDAVQEKAVQF